MASKNALNSSGGRLAQRFSRISLISAPGSTPRAMTDDAMTERLRPSDLPLTGCGSPLRCSPLFLLLTPLRRRRLVGGGCSVRRSVSTLTMFRRLAVSSGRRSGTGAKPARSQGAAANASRATPPGRRAMLYASHRTHCGRASSSSLVASRSVVRAGASRSFFGHFRHIPRRAGAVCPRTPRACLRVEGLRKLSAVKCLYAASLFPNANASPGSLGGKIRAARPGGSDRETTRRNNKTPYTTSSSSSSSSTEEGRPQHSAFHAERSNTRAPGSKTESSPS